MGVEPTYPVASRLPDPILHTAICTGKQLLANGRVPSQDVPLVERCLRENEEEWEARRREEERGDRF